MNIAISGSSKGGVTIQKVREKLSVHVGKDNHWILGGAKGVDQFALEYLIENNEDFEVIVPSTIQEQPKRPYEGARSVGETLEEVNDRVIELNHKSFPWAPAYYYRNDKMLENANLLLAFPRNSEEQTGGTWYTIKKAEELKITTVIFDCSD